MSRRDDFSDFGDIGDDARAAFDRAMRDALTSIGPPPPAHHPPEHRRAAIDSAIANAWLTGAPPTPEDLINDPHPVDRWDDWTPGTFTDTALAPADWNRDSPNAAWPWNPPSTQPDEHNPSS